MANLIHICSLAIFFCFHCELARTWSSFVFLDEEGRKRLVVLGSGDFGLALTARLVQANYNVVVASRDPNRTRYSIHNSSTTFFAGKLTSHYSLFSRFSLLPLILWAFQVNISRQNLSIFLFISFLLPFSYFIENEWNRLEVYPWTKQTHYSRATWWSWLYHSNTVPHCPSHHWGTRYSSMSVTGIRQFSLICWSFI